MYLSRNAPNLNRSSWHLDIGVAVALLLAVIPKAGSSAEPAVPAAGMSSPVVVVHDPQATVTLKPQPLRVQAMVDTAVQTLTGADTREAAWRGIANSNDVVAVKVFSALGPNTGTRLSVVAAVVDGLVSAGVIHSNIIIWDRSKTDLIKSGYNELARSKGVELEGAVETGYDENDSYNFALITGLRFGDLEFGQQGEGVGRRSFVTRILGPRVTKIISIAPAANKLSTGVTGHLYSMTMGAVDNTWRFENHPSTMPWAIPELYAKESIGDRVVLCVTDALICQYQGEEASLLHYSAVANEIYVGTDPVALDLLAIQILERERRASDALEIKPNMDLYRNAALLQLGVDDLNQVSIRRVALNETNDSAPRLETTNGLTVPPAP